MLKRNDGSKRQLGVHSCVYDQMKMQIEDIRRKGHKTVGDQKSNCCREVSDQLRFSK